MAERRPPAVLRGALLFLLGGLVGANAVYYAMTRSPRVAAATSNRAHAEPAPAASPSNPGATVFPRDAPRRTSSAPDIATTPGADAASALLIPVQGIAATGLQDTFNDARGNNRVHDAIDIMAPAGTPVLAVADGHVEKLFDSKQGGLTLYQFNTDRTRAYYYAHLQGYADGIVEQKPLRRGETIGYVGATGNANPDAPHLHFAIFVLGPERQWWKGEAINPYPLLGGIPE